MIDAHVHVFPPPASHLATAAGAAALLENMASSVAPRTVARARRLWPLLSSAAETASRVVAETLPQMPLHIEQLAKFRRMGPREAHVALELGASLTLLPQILLRGTFEHLAVSMRDNGIERSVVIAAPPVASNDWLLEECSRRGDAFVPVCTLPDLPSDASQDEWEASFQSLVSLGAKGFKIHPNADGLPASHPAYRALFEVARRERRFVILHTGCFCVLGYKNLRPADPRDFGGYFSEYKDVKVCLAHMNRDDPEVVFDLLRTNDQLFADTSWQPADVVRRAVATVGAERIMMGSDWPLLRSDLQKEMLSVVREALTDTSIEAVSGTTARTFLG